MNQIDSGALLQALFEATCRFMCLLARDGAMLRANGRMLEFAGLDAQPAGDPPAWETPWWSGCPRSREALRQAVGLAAGGNPQGFTANWSGRDGSAARVECTLSPVPDAAGRINRLLLEAVDVTARYAAENALRAQKAMLDGFFHAAPVGMAIMDRELRYLYVNEVLAAAHALPAADHVGKTIHEVIPDVAPALACLYQLVLNRNEPIYGMPMSARLPDAPERLRHGEVSLYPISDGAGRVAYLGAMVVDVTDREQALAELKAKTAEFEEAQRLAQVGSWELRLDSNLLSWSAEVFRITGRDPARHAPRGAEQAALYRPEGWRQVCEGFKSLLAGEKGYEMMLEIVRPDGSTRWVIARGEPKLDEAGRLHAVRGTIQDITESRRRADNNAALAGEVMDLYQNAPCGYHSLDGDGRIVRINDTELAWLGYSRVEVLGQKLTEFLTPASKARFAKTFARLKEQGTVRDIEHEMLRKDGSILPVLLNSTALFDERGRFLMSRAMVTDMTENRRQAADRLRQEARRTEIARHLVDVEEEERRRLALAVHDEVSPNLAAVQINLGIIEAGIPLKAREYLGPRLEDVRQLLRDTHQSLRNINSRLRPPLLDYVGLYGAVENLVEQFAERTGINIELTGGEADGRLSADLETLFYRIIQEALANCAKHAEASRVTVELGYDSRHAHLEIVDDGVGFDPAALCADGRRPGLGLLTMAERAELAGGQFRLESRPGQGTRITVEI